MLLVLPHLAFIGCIPPEEALLAQGEDLLARHAYKEASLLFTRYIQLCPDDPQGYFDRGSAHLEAGDLDDADKDFAKAILLNPGDVDLWRARYRVRQRLGENLDPATVSKGERPVMETLKSALSILRMIDLRRILRLAPDDRSARLVYATLLSQRGLREEALKELDRSVLEAPFDADVLNERGRLLHEMGRYDDAIKDYDVALRYCDSCTLLKFNRGLSLEKSGRTAEAVAAFQDVVAEDSLDGEAWLNLGELQHLLGRKEQGCASIRKSMSLGIPEARVLYETLCR